MVSGINMGRRCPWSKEYIVNLYNKLDTYCKAATINALKNEGAKVASETMAAYSMFKYPVVYIYIHYHYGSFENLGLPQNEISAYMMYLTMVRHFPQGMMDGMLEQTVFNFDKKNEIAPALIEVCKEVIFIEDNF